MPILACKWGLLVIVTIVMQRFWVAWSAFTCFGYNVVSCWDLLQYLADENCQLLMQVTEARAGIICWVGWKCGPSCGGVGEARTSQFCQDFPRCNGCSTSKAPSWKRQSSYIYSRQGWMQAVSRIHGMFMLWRCNRWTCIMYLFSPLHSYNWLVYGYLVGNGWSFRNIIRTWWPEIYIWYCKETSSPC